MAMKTPGVYIVEKNAFPNSVVEVATAVPAFIGYTEKADNKGKSLTRKPFRISSIIEFHEYFGGSPNPVFKIEESKGETQDTPAAAKPKAAAAKDKADNPAGDGNGGGSGNDEDSDFTQGGNSYRLTQVGGHYLLYRSILLFFQNGGGPCYIVSVGSYGEQPRDKAQEVVKSDLESGIAPLVKEQEPTMVVIPEAVLLEPGECASLQAATLMHCGGKMKNRIAILDVHGGHREQNDNNCVENFRNAVGTNFLNFGAAYYPWVNTTIVEDKDLGLNNLHGESYGLLKTLLDGDVTAQAGDEAAAKLGPQKARIQQIGSSWSDETKGESGDRKQKHIDELNRQLDTSLVAMSPLYRNMRKAIREKLNLLPPAAAMAGIYTMVDSSRGVWKAPANVSLNSVKSPAVNVTHEEQEDLNVDANGKSINAIRSFIGEGTLVWGARTLDGNSLDWRYINVRRTMIMLEESIRLAAKAYVFEPNDANTWVTMKSMIRNFLTGIWKRGGLAGAVPDEAFRVHVGLGDTMTPEDILEGILRITVLVAISRPAEFIEITFQQKMQES